jgi:predicted nucleotidyltransferase
VKHAERLRIAENFVTLLRRKYPVRAAAVVGSTAKGKDQKHSDLEIAVIVGGKKPVDEHFIHRGIAISTEFHTDEEVRQDLTIPRSRYVWIVNEYSMAHVLHDPENLYEEYKRLISDAGNDFWRGVAEHTLIVAYEQLNKARNQAIIGDHGKLRMPCIWFAEVVASYTAAVNRRFFTTTWDLFDSHNIFLDQPEGFAEAFPRLCGLVQVDAKELLPLAEQLWEGTLAHAASRNLELKTHEMLEDSLGSS